MKDEIIKYIESKGWMTMGKRKKFNQKEYNKQWLRDHRKQQNAWLKEWRKRNPEKAKAIRDRYYKKHSEKFIEAGKRYRERNRELVNQRARDKAQSIKLQVLQHYGLRCNNCGIDNPILLTIDHIMGDGAAHRRRDGWKGFKIYKYLLDNDFPEGFQVLCWNCNYLKFYTKDRTHAQ